MKRQIIDALLFTLLAAWALGGCVWVICTRGLGALLLAFAPPIAVVLVIAVLGVKKEGKS